MMNATLELTLLRKRHIALLYYFSSTQYLLELSELVDELTSFVDVVLSKAAHEHRDQVLEDKQWGQRNTSENWANYAWPFLVDYKRSLSRDIANRAYDLYQETGTNQFIRGSDEYSLQWTTPVEQKEYEKRVYQISHYATAVDDTLTRASVDGRWDDFNLAMAWKENEKKFHRLPKLRVLTELEAITGSIPPRTGVYIPADDVHGAPQFAWCGRHEHRRDGILLECSTFNDIGLHALKHVGRRDLWFNDQKMYEFAMLPQYAAVLQQHVNIRGKSYTNLGPSAVARHAFTSRPCKWCFVEVIEGEYEDYDDSTIPARIDERVRVLGGEYCPRSGCYFTPAKQGSHRYFEQGELMPDFPNSWGTVIWQSTE